MPSLVDGTNRFFEEYSVQDYARTGCIATETFTLPSGVSFCKVDVLQGIFNVL